MIRNDSVSRRTVLKSLLAGIPALALDWESFPRGKAGRGSDGPYDAVIIGSGLGGLSCAAAFARQGFRPLVLEQHTVAGGYATTFKRPGGFIFDVSLHSTSVGERAGLHNLIPGFPEIVDVEFVPWRVVAQNDGCAASIPLVDHDVCTGVLNAYFSDATQLTTARLRLLATIAAAATSAIEFALSKEAGPCSESAELDLAA